MPDRLIANLVGLIEGRYGAYEGEEREVVAGYLNARIEASQETVARAFDAIRQACMTGFGPPDEARVKAAITAYEDEYGVDLRSRRPERSVPEPESVSEAETEQLREIAERAGIDTREEGWMARYFFRRCGELAREKRFA